MVFSRQRFLLYYAIMSLSYFLKKFDWVLLVLVLAVMLLGIATFHNTSLKAPDFINRQIFFVVIGLALMIAVSLFDYRILKNFSSASILIYTISVILLFFALASKEIRGVSSWIVIRNLTFEPSEFAKLALLILLAKYFSQKHVEIYHTRHILASGIYTLVPAALTLIQPDLGSVVVFVVLWLAMLLFAGIKRKHMLTIIMAGIVIITSAWFLAFKPYQKDRILSFINPYLDPRGRGYNTLQAKTTFGSGQLLGTVFGKGSSKVLVPEPYNDFAFANFAHKFGLVGITFLVLLLLAFMLRIGSIAMKTDNNFAKLFSLGFMTIVFVHIFINAGMNMGLLPITGIPFSFLSYGGSHLLTLMLGLGVIQNINLSQR